ncbi:MAG: PAS domain S-box protein, partial [Bacteroidetes bacterium]|nr:PAS domain S-box protein [Bacteroidota bacterium]
MIENNKVKNQLLQSLVYNARDHALFIIDVKGDILTWNRGARYIKGYRDDEIIGRNFRIFYREEDQRKGKPEKLLETVKKENQATVEGWFVRKNGKTFWGSIAITSIRNKEGVIIGFGTIIQDLTRLKLNEEKFKNLLEFAPDAMIAADANGIIQLVNKQVENIFGYKRKEIIGLKVEVLIPERFRKKHPDLRNSYSAKPYVRHMSDQMELYGLRKSGKEFPVEISLSPLKTEEETLTMATIRDITSKKILIDKLIKAKEKAEESDRLKSSFLTTMSHELRTPLNHILGLSNLIPDMTDDESVKEFSNLIHKSGSDLLSLIVDILDLAFLEKKEINRQDHTFNIGELYVELKKLLQEVLFKHRKNDFINLNFQIDDKLLTKIIIADKPKINRVMKNLIKNAVKFTKNGSITLSIENPSKESLTISVKDTGIGISKENQKGIFEFFTQIDDSLTRKFDGTGIGLAI